MKSSTHSFIHVFNKTSINFHLSTHSFIHPSIHLFIHPYTHLLIHIYPPIHLCIHLSINLYSSIHPTIRLSIIHTSLYFFLSVSSVGVLIYHYDFSCNFICKHIFYNIEIWDFTKYFYFRIMLSSETVIIRMSIDGSWAFKNKISVVKDDLKKKNFSVADTFGFGSAHHGWNSAPLLVSSHKLWSRLQVSWSLPWATLVPHSQAWREISMGLAGRRQACYLLEVTEMIQDDQSPIVTIMPPLSQPCPQFQLPHSGSINYYSNCFSQPTDSKLTACSSVLLHRRGREWEKWRERKIRRDRGRKEVK